MASCLSWCIKRPTDTSATHLGNSTGSKSVLDAQQDGLGRETTCGSTASQVFSGQRGPQTVASSCGEPAGPPAAPHHHDLSLPSASPRTSGSERAFIPSREPSTPESLDARTSLHERQQAAAQATRPQSSQSPPAPPPTASAAVHQPQPADAPAVPPATSSVPPSPPPPAAASTATTATAAAKAVAAAANAAAVAAAAAAFTQLNSLMPLHDELTHLSWLGSGSGGRVYSGLWRGSPVAVKIIVSCTPDEVWESLREAVLNRVASHPHMVQCFAAFSGYVTEDDVAPSGLTAPLMAAIQHGAGSAAASASGLVIHGSGSGGRTQASPRRRWPPSPLLSSSLGQGLPHALLQTPSERERKLQAERERLQFRDRDRLPREPGQSQEADRGPAQLAAAGPGHVAQPSPPPDEALLPGAAAAGARLLRPLAMCAAGAPPCSTGTETSLPSPRDPPRVGLGSSGSGTVAEGQLQAAAVAGAAWGPEGDGLQQGATGDRQGEAPGDVSRTGHSGSSQRFLPRPGQPDDEEGQLHEERHRHHQQPQQQQQPQSQLHRVHGDVGEVVGGQWMPSLAQSFLGSQPQRPDLRHRSGEPPPHDQSHPLHDSRNHPARERGGSGPVSEPITAAAAAAALPSSFPGSGPAPQCPAAGGGPSSDGSLATRLAGRAEGAGRACSPAALLSGGAGSAPEPAGPLSARRLGGSALAGAGMGGRLRHLSTGQAQDRGPDGPDGPPARCNSRSASLRHARVEDVGCGAQRLSAPEGESRDAPSASQPQPHQHQHPHLPPHKQTQQQQQQQQPAAAAASTQPTGTPILASSPPAALRSSVGGSSSLSLRATVGNSGGGSGAGAAGAAGAGTAARLLAAAAGRTGFGGFCMPADPEGAVSQNHSASTVVSKPLSALGLGLGLEGLAAAVSGVAAATAAGASVVGAGGAGSSNGAQLAHSGGGSAFDKRSLSLINLGGGAASRTTLTLSDLMESTVLDEQGLAASELWEVLAAAGAVPGRHCTLVVMEMCDQGTLQQVMQRHPPFSAVRSAESYGGLISLLRTALEVAQGMCHLHSLDIVHGDLKPSNVLLQSNVPLVARGTSRKWEHDSRGYTAKVADFGLAAMQNVDSTTGAPRVHASASPPAGSQGAPPNPGRRERRWGSLPYMAPEVPEHGPSKKSDVWSFGMLLYFMCCGQPPYSSYAQLRPAQLLMGIVEGSLSLDWPAETYRLLRRLAETCCQRNPGARPPFSRIVPALQRLVRHVAEHPEPASRNSRTGSSQGRETVLAHHPALAGDALASTGTGTGTGTTGTTASTLSLSLSSLRSDFGPGVGGTGGLGYDVWEIREIMATTSKPRKQQQQLQLMWSAKGAAAAAAAAAAAPARDVPPPSPLEMFAGCLTVPPSGGATASSSAARQVTRVGDAGGGGGPIRSAAAGYASGARSNLSPGLQSSGMDGSSVCATECSMAVDRSSYTCMDGLSATLVEVVKSPQLYTPLDGLSWFAQPTAPAAGEASQRRSTLQGSSESPLTPYSSERGSTTPVQGDGDGGPGGTDDGGAEPTPSAAKGAAEAQADAEGGRAAGGQQPSC